MIRKGLLISLLLLLCGVVAADSVGPTNPNTAVSTAPGPATHWSNPGLVQIEDDLYALAFHTSPVFTANTAILRATNYAFNIPSDAVIDGVVVEVKRSATNQVSLIEIGLAGVFATNKTDSEFWPSTFAYKEYGSPTDKWDAPLTPAVVNASSFGVDLTAQLGVAVSGATEARVDHIRMTVYYTVSRTMPKRSVVVSQSRSSKAFSVAGGVR